MEEIDGVETVVVDAAMEKAESTALAAVDPLYSLSKSELESQMDAAHKYPRVMSAVLREACSLATLNREVAASCMYALPRGGKPITGPSVRLAEIMASSYGNMHVATRVMQVTATETVARAICWDIQKNLKVEVEARRLITGKKGRFQDDMINVTGAAAMSIAKRNAIFSVIPRSIVDQVYQKARKVSVGDAKTLVARRAEMVERLQKIGVPIERIFVRVGGAKIEDIGLDELEILVGLGTAIKDGALDIDGAFPPPEQSTGKAANLAEKLAGMQAQHRADAGSKAEQKAEQKAEVPHDADGVVPETDEERAAKVERGEA